MRERRRQKQRVVTKEQRLSKTGKPAPKSSTSSGFYYSFLTIILLLCLVQITISAVLNVSNEMLKDNINNFSNVSGLEAIARNNLKMSSEDEVLVIINTPKEELPEKPKKTGFIRHD